MLLDTNIFNQFYMLELIDRSGKNS